MTPEQLVQILVALNMAGLLANLSQWWTRKQETLAARHFTDADQSRAEQRAREDRLLARIDELEQWQSDREVAMAAELKELRQAIADCQKAHTESRVMAAGLQAENAAMKRQLDDLMRTLDRRHSNSGPPEGQRERRRE